jgi:hypothetical protein
MRPDTARHQRFHLLLTILYSHFIDSKLLDVPFYVNNPSFRNKFEEYNIHSDMTTPTSASVMPKDWCFVIDKKIPSDFQLFLTTFHPHFIGSWFLDAPFYVSTPYFRNKLDEYKYSHWHYHVIFCLGYARRLAVSVSRHGAIRSTNIKKRLNQLC